MPDYAISAVGQASTDERLLASGPGNEVLRFEEIGSRQCSSRDLSNDSWNQIRIIQSPSPQDTPLNNEKTPWANLSTRALDSLDDIQRQWNNVMKPSSYLDASSQTDITGENSLRANRAEFQNILKAFHRIIDIQVRLTVVTSIATMTKNSISTLYRQQG